MPLHAELKPIREFKFPSSDPYLLDMFGGVFRNPNDPGNPLIECLLTPCSPRSDGFEGFRRRISEQVRVGVGVGNLTNLYAGRFVQDGQFTEAIPLSDHRLEHITFEIDTRMPNFSEEGFLGDIPFDPSNSPISIRQKNAGVQSQVKLLHGQVLATNRSNVPEKWSSPKNPQKFTVMIHELELIRFYYSNSSNLCRAVFSDAFTEDNLDRAIVAGNPPYSYDEDTDTHSFVHRLGFSEEDMPFLGRIICEPDEVALRGARRIYQSTRATRMNSLRPDMMGYPRTSLPFQQKVQLSLTGHRSKVGDSGYLFVVHHIDACSAAFPFRNLSYCSVRASGIVTHDIEAPEPQAPKNRPKTGPANSTKDQQGTNRSDVHPAADSIPISREVGSRLFTGLASVIQTRENRTVPVPPRTRRIPTFDPQLIDWSTGKPGYGGTSAARLTQTDRLERGQLSADLSTFISVIDALRQMEPTWAIDSIPIGDNSWTDEATEVWRGFFPLVNCITRRSMLFKFSFVNDERTERRQLICIELQIGNSFVYLLEAQRRLARSSDGTGFVDYRDTLPVLMLRRNDWHPVEENELSEMLKDTVANPSKTWPQKVRGFVRDAIDHGNGADTPDKLAKRIAMVVKRNLP